jgi:DNA-binding GntR family transcriptional regulator
MAQMTQTGNRRTSVDIIFDHLHDEITDLRLLPGDKISEADIAGRFGVSRQPVRDAFSRLENLDLLLIRPQRATEVKRFSTREIEKSRFTRVAVECEVVRRASQLCDEYGRKKLAAALELQAKAVEARNYETFGALDYDFHRTLCDIAGVDFAYEVIASQKAKVDRLCILSISKEDRMPQLLDDHQKIFDAITSGDATAAMEAVVLHLSRLDATIAAISKSNADYFDT